MNFFYIISALQKRGIPALKRSREHRTPHLRAFCALAFCRRNDIEPPSVKQQEIKCAEVEVSRKWSQKIPDGVSRIRSFYYGVNLLLTQHILESIRIQNLDERRYIFDYSICLHFLQFSVQG